MLKRFMIVAMAVMFFGSCTVACSRWAAVNTPVRLSKAKESVYKVQVEMELDLSEVAYLGAPPRYKTSSTGTAFIVQSEGGRTRLITAGHVCESPGDVVSIDRSIPYTFPIISAAYTLIDENGASIPGGRVVLDMDTQDGHGVDLCMLSFPGTFGSPLPIAKSDPEWNDEIDFIGAPAGMWGGGIAFAGHGRYMGRGTPFKGTKIRMTFAVFASPGASGAPIFWNGKVVAVLVAGNSDYWNCIIGVPYDMLREFITLAGRVPDAS